MGFDLKRYRFTPGLSPGRINEGMYWEDARVAITAGPYTYGFTDYSRVDILGHRVQICQLWSENEPCFTALVRPSRQRQIDRDSVRRCAPHPLTSCDQRGCAPGRHTSRHHCTSLHLLLKECSHPGGNPGANLKLISQ